MDSVYWICAMVVFLIVEAVTPMLVSIWFALGALAGAICAFAGLNETVCMLVFALVSASSIIIFRKFYSKKLEKKHQPTNADRLIGKTGIVESDIDPVKGKGTVDVGGNLWSAKSDSEIKAGSTVVVLKIEGVKLVVEER